MRRFPFTLGGTLCAVLACQVMADPRPATALETAELRIAVAANFRAAFEALAKAYPHAARLVPTFGSSGLLAAQISQGAPFDVFLSADLERPAQLIASGRAAAPVEIYAVGQVALWTPGRRPDPAQLVGTRFAMANPELAPYGAAARECLAHLGIWQRLDAPPVLGTSIAQAFHFVASGAVTAGFVAESSLREQGIDEAERWLCPPGSHAPIEQGAVSVRDSPAARLFLAHLTGPDAQREIERFGYEPRRQ